VDITPETTRSMSSNLLIKFNLRCSPQENKVFHIYSDVLMLLLFGLGIDPAHAAMTFEEYTLFNDQRFSDDVSFNS